MDRIASRSAAFGALVVLAITAGCAGSKRMGSVPEAMLGGWSGNAKILITWGGGQSLPVALSIAPAGHVEGKVGGAVLREGYLAKNRGPIGRWLHIKTDFIVRGELEGVVVTQEPIESRVVFIPFNLVEREPGERILEGGVTTSRGALVFEKNIAVAAADLVLRRAIGPKEWRR